MGEKDSQAKFIPWSPWTETSQALWIRTSLATTISTYTPTPVNNESNGFTGKYSYPRKSCFPSGKTLQSVLQIPLPSAENIFSVTKLPGDSSSGVTTVSGLDEKCSISQSNVCSEAAGGETPEEFKVS